VVAELSHKLKNGCWGATPSTCNFRSTGPLWSKITDFEPIFVRSTSAVTPSKKVQLTLIITRCKSTRPRSQPCSFAYHKNPIFILCNYTLVKLLFGLEGSLPSPLTMATPHVDVKAMQNEIIQLTPTVETLTKDVPSVLSHRKTLYSTDGDESPMQQMCSTPPILRHYDEYRPSHANAAKRKEIPARRFSGKESVTDYLKQFELTARHNRWSDEDNATRLLCTLDGQGGSILAQIDDLGKIRYSKVKQKLLQRFGPTQHPGTGSARTSDS